MRRTRQIKLRHPPAYRGGTWLVIFQVVLDIQLGGFVVRRAYILNVPNSPVDSNGNRTAYYANNNITSVMNTVKQGDLRVTVPARM